MRERQRARGRVHERDRGIPWSLCYLAATISQNLLGRETERDNERERVNFMNDSRTEPLHSSDNWFDLVSSQTHRLLCLSQRIYNRIECDMIQNTVMCIYNIIS